MEYVSVLAGERFTDRPRCTHPALATVARYVNDSVGDATRAHLVTVAPSLVRAGRRDPAAYAAAIVVCAAAGLRIDTEDPLLAGCASAATRRLRAITEARLDTARAVDRLVHTGVVPWRRLPGIVVGLVRARSVAPRRAATLRTVLARLDDLLVALDPGERDHRLVAVLTELLRDEPTATGGRAAPGLATVAGITAPGTRPRSPWLF